MAKLLNFINQKIASIDPLILSGLISSSAALQYIFFFSGMRSFISANFDHFAFTLTPKDFMLDDLVVGGPEVANFLTQIAFRLNPDVPKAVIHQLLSAALLSACIAQGFGAAIPSVLCLLGSAGAIYAAWTPLVDLYALSSVIRDGNETAYRRLALMVLKQQQRDRTKWRTAIGTSSVAFMSLAIFGSLRWRLALPTTALYLFAVTF